MEKEIGRKLFSENSEYSIDLSNFNFEPIKKLTAILLTFLFLTTPFSWVFAQEATITSPGVSVISSVPEADKPLTTSPENLTPPILEMAPVTHEPVNTDVQSDTSANTSEKMEDTKSDGKGTQLLTASSPFQPLVDSSDPYKPTNKNLLEVDKNTGGLNNKYIISVPPGRNGLQPDLALTYNSQNRQDAGVFGYGWGVNIPYIERFNKTGSEKLYSTSTPSYFLSSMDGELATTTATSTYVSRIDNGNFNTYTYSSNQWLVIDKNGIQYKFGYATTTQQNDPNITGNVYKWMLQEVRDTNNNYISYTYYKDAGQIYPSTIKYTGNGVSDGIFEVDFLREARTDTATSSAAGFVVNSKWNFPTS